MRADIVVSRDRTGETMVVQVEGATEAGTEFVDAYNDDELFVVDAGRIIIPEQRLGRLTRWAGAEGLEVQA